MNTDFSLNFALQPNHPRRLANLCGLANDHLQLIGQRLDVRIFNRGNEFELIGEQDQCQAAQLLLEELYQQTKDHEILADDVHLALSSHIAQQAMTQVEPHQDKLYVVNTPKALIRPRSPNQKAYVHQVMTNDINFGIGPAGTGKTFLAVACAVQALTKDEVKRIILVRPAVEAGEKLGFLPGDLSQKVDPYLRPLFDALYEMLGFEKVDRMIERNIIEIAPLAYMRGRTLSHAFVILDESQNTTREQMKMFLTRIGFGSTAVITGDPTQIDLPRGQASGLKHALDILQPVPGLSFSFFQSKDVVRHPLVQRIVDAYEQHESNHES